MGHTGTLDPFATGLLVLLIGRGTRLIPYVDGEPKVYEGTIRFGVETDTDDSTGTMVREAAAPSDVGIVEGIARLTGPIDQVPPAFSAKQVNGTRAYDAARRGAALDLAPARVVVHRWEVLGRSGHDMSVRISCGTGTYIRALARDLGRIAGSAAHLASLRRIRSGPFSVCDAFDMNDLKAGRAILRPLSDAMPSIPLQQLDPGELARVTHGGAIAPRVAGDRVALIDDSRMLIALATRSGDELRPKVVLRDA